MIVWRDGELVSGEGALSAADRAFLIGDGVFETILVEAGAPAFLDAHLARLARGMAALGIRYDINAAAIRAAIGALSEKVGLNSPKSARAACRLTLSRVGGARGLLASADARAQLLISLAPAPASPTIVSLIIARAPRFAKASTVGFKCVGAYGENMFARAEAAAAGAHEAIMLNEYGRVACASAANIFLVRGDAILTPPVSEGAMPGVVRGVILEEARAQGVSVEETPIAPEALNGARLFLSNSLIGMADAVLPPAPSKLPEAPLVDRLKRRYAERLAAETGAQGKGGK